MVLAANQTVTQSAVSFGMQGKHVIELGAGCGLVGLVFAALGAQVLLTDLPNVLVSQCCHGSHTPISMSISCFAFKQHCGQYKQYTHSTVLGQSLLKLH